MKHGWEDVLEEQHWLFKFWRSDFGHAAGRGFAESTAKSNGETTAEWMTGGAKVANLEASKILFANPIYVSDEMFDVAEAASLTFQPEPLAETDLITPNGFVLLPRPIITPDIHGKPIAYRAFSWMPAQSEDSDVTGIHISAYTYFDDFQDDGYGPELMAMLDKYPARERDRIIQERFRWNLLFMTPWVFGRDLPDHHFDEKADGYWWVKVQSMFRLMMQHITTRDETMIPRASRRRWAKAAPDFTKTKVTVVKLRRPKHKPTGEERDIEWTHRWIVGGHWRNQWFPSLEAHRQIWISDYVKGPDDKPLVIRKARAFELVK